MVQYIPYDTQVEIFLRLPCKSLLQFRVVCKSWNSIITDNDFCIHHHHRNEFRPRWVSICPTVASSRHQQPPHQSPYLLFHDNSFTNFARQPFQRKPVCSRTIIGSCHGLLCLCIISPTTTVAFEYKFYISNPVLRQCKEVISFSELDAHGRNFVFGFGYAPGSKDYKVAVIKKEDWWLKVYSLRKNTIEDKPLVSLKSFRKSQREGVYNNGVCHWLLLDEGGKPTHGILCFNLDVEDFGCIMVPEIIVQQSAGSDLFVTHFTLFVYKDMLAISFCKNKQGVGGDSRVMSWHVWVMKEYGACDSWTAITSLDLDNINMIYFRYASIPLEKDNDGEIVLHNSSSYRPIKLLVYNPWSQNIKMLEVTSYFNMYDRYVVYSNIRYLPYKESVVSLEIRENSSPIESYKRNWSFLNKVLARVFILVIAVCAGLVLLAPSLQT